jgi:hypothetical protein
MHDARTVKSRAIHDRHISLLILTAVLTPHTATAQAIPLQASDALARNESDSTDAMAELSRQIDAIQREYDAAVQHATPRKED